MMIYSHIGIDKDIISKSYEYLNDFGETSKFSIDYNEELVVNMPYVGIAEHGSNAQGWLRKSSYYFDEMILKNPMYFSEINIERIKQKRSPYCDSSFIKYFPEYENFLGSKLIHHHIGRDGQAVAVPENIHVGQGGVHVIERSIGVDTNANKFSTLVSNKISEGIDFSWDDAEKYVEEYSINSDTNRKSNEHLQEEKKYFNKVTTKKNKLKNEDAVQNNSSSFEVNINYKQFSTSNESLNSSKIILNTRTQKLKSAVTTPIAKKVILGSLVAVTLSVSSRTPKGKKLIKNFIGNFSSNGTERKFVKNTSKGILKRNTAKVVNGRIVNPMLSSQKSPHIRSAHLRKLASGEIISVKEAKIHADVFI